MLLNSTPINKVPINGSGSLGPSIVSGSISEILSASESTGAFLLSRILESLIIGSVTYDGNDQVLILNESLSFTESFNIKKNLVYSVQDSIEFTELLGVIGHYGLGVSDVIDSSDSTIRFSNTPKNISEVINTTNPTTFKVINGISNSFNISSSTVVKDITGLLSSFLVSDPVALKLVTSNILADNIGAFDEISPATSVSYSITDSFLSIVFSTNTHGAVASSTIGTSDTTNTTLTLNLLNNVLAVTVINTKRRLLNTSEDTLLFSSIVTLNNFTQCNSIFDLYTETVSTAFINIFNNININSLLSDSKYISRSIASSVSLLTAFKFLSVYSVNDALDISQSMSYLIKSFTKVIDDLLFTESVDVKSNYIRELVESISLLHKGSGELVTSILDSLNISMDLSVLRLAFENYVDSLYIGSSIESNSVLIVPLNESLNVEESTDIFSTLRSILKDNILLVIPEGRTKGKYLSYAYSPETSSTSNYDNYNFNGCAVFEDKYLFYNELGIYEYGGMFDDGVPITSEVSTSAMMFGTDNLKSIPNVYLGATSSGPLVLKVRVDGKGEFLYKLNKNTNNLQTQKISIGKGLIGRYFQFELITSSDTLNIDSIEFLPVELKRKL